MAELTANDTRLMSGRLLAHNVFFNLIGQGVPLVAAIFAIPLLIEKLGIERFGILTLSWMVIGYFSLFDLGLGRALTQLVAEKLGVGLEKDIPALVWTAMLLMMIMGTFGAALVGLLVPWLVDSMLKIPEALQQETLHTFYLLAISIPVMISITGLRGFLEAQQRFGLINAVRIPMGLFTFLGPLLVLPFSNSLVAIVSVLLVGRIIAWAIHLILCVHVMPSLRRGSIQRSMIRPLLHFGSWMTISNMIGPLMVYLDRFLIGALISVVAVAYYATPYEVVTKLWVIPIAFVAVLFPAFAASFAKDHARVVRLFSRGLKYIFISLLPITLVIVALADVGLELWLGTEFVQNSTRVLQILAIGVFINSLAKVPFALIQGAGRPDLTAKFHLLELLFYLPAIWWLTTTYGIEGAAIAWVVRIVLDTILLFAISFRFLKVELYLIQRMALTFSVGLVTLLIAAVPMSLGIKGIYLFCTLIILAILTWTFMLAPVERAMLLNRLKIRDILDQA